MVDIPKGANDGERITFDGVTDEKIGHHTGNLVLVITTNPHKLFKRVGDNLHMEWTVSLHDALVGFTRTFEHIDGRVVTVTRDVVTRPDEYHTVQGEGMPRKSGGKGNLIIHYTIDFPPSLTVIPQHSIRILVAIAHMRCSNLKKTKSARFWVEQPPPICFSPRSGVLEYECRLFFHGFKSGWLRELSLYNWLAAK
jgi:DnaJ-class molecular chaperone